MIAVAEAITALLIFGAVVAKFVSHRQEELVSEIHRVTFEDRLDRIETNLHMVISELLAITAMTETKAPLNRINTRLESAVILFSGELRTTRDLLYQPRLLVEEGVLAAILATLASAMNVLAELLTLMPPEFARSQPSHHHPRSRDRPRRGNLRRMRPPHLHPPTRLLDEPNPVHRPAPQITPVLNLTRSFTGEAAGRIAAGKGSVASRISIRISRSCLRLT